MPQGWGLYPIFWVTDYSRRATSRDFVQTVVASDRFEIQQYFADSQALGND